MTNRSKAKGDQAERDAVEVFRILAGDLIDTPKAERLLGAGRKDDVGDLRLFTDAAVQVKAFRASNLGGAVHQSAAGAVRQAGNAMVDLAVGIVKRDRIRAGGVRWIACCRDWPMPVESPLEFGTVSRAVDWVGDDSGPRGYMAYPREERIALLTIQGVEPVFIAPIEAWVVALRQHRAGIASVSALRTA